MRHRLGIRLAGTLGFVAVFASAQAQINVSSNPNGYASLYTENFQEFVTQGSSPFSAAADPIFSSNGSMSLTNPADGTFMQIYSPDVVPPTGLGLGYGGYADTYNSLPQGADFQNNSNYGNSDIYMADITIAMTPGTEYDYFGGYFQAAELYNPNDPLNFYTGQITFSFYNGAALIDTLTETTQTTYPGTNELVGLAFTSNAPVDDFTSVQISGDFVAMGSLRIDTQIQSVPEPAPFAVMGLGIGALALLRRRRR